MHVEPLRIFYLIGLRDDLSACILRVKTQHHGVRERPTLAAHILDVFDLKLHFFTHLANQALLRRLPRLGKPPKVL